MVAYRIYWLFIADLKEITNSDSWSITGLIKALDSYWWSIGGLMDNSVQLLVVYWGLNR